MYKPVLGVFSALVLAAISLPAASAEAGSTKATDSAQTSVPAATTGGTPASGGKGPGMGRAYRQNTPGPGRGGPDYRGGQPVAPAPAAAPTDNAPESQQPANPGQGAINTRGYPDPDIYRSGSRRYRQGYGRGYGRGYGYPGYRGNGGYSYPRHRQYATPPLYRAPAVPADTPASRD